MRLPRLALAQVLQNVVIRGNNDETIFHAPHDYVMYLDFLLRASQKYQCDIHAYALMGDHVHLLLTPRQDQSLAKTLQLLARWYVQYFNHRYDRSGSLFAGRYKSALVESERYGLECCRYIDTNPVRIGLVEKAENYIWSSYRFHAGISDVKDKIGQALQPLEAYTQLGDTPVQRAAQYALFCQQKPALEVSSHIRRETERSRVVGSESFRQDVEKLLGVELDAKPRGGDRRSVRYRRSLACNG